MRSNAYQSYLEAEILAADPVRLVEMLYRAALGAVGNARKHLNAGDIGNRSQQITKVMEILAELLHSLDAQQGGEISERLLALYDYMQVRLLEANGQQTDLPLAEVERLLTTLLEGWSAVPARRPPIESSALLARPSY